MAPPKVAAGLLLLAFVVAGCAGGPPPGQKSQAAAAPTAAAGLGAVAGVVLDEESLPVGHVEVGLLQANRTTHTDDTGAFTLNDVAPGRYTLATERIGYAAEALTVVVKPDEIARVSVTLREILFPEDAVVLVESFTGWINCSHNVYYPTNECGKPLGTDKDHFPVALDGAMPFKQLLLEVSWEPATPATGQQLELDLCLPQDATTNALHCAQDHLGEDFYEYRSGKSPVVMNLTADKMPVPDHLTFEAWVGSGFLSPYPTVQQAFTLYVTACYVTECPPGTTALPAAG